MNLNRWFFRTFSMTPAILLAALSALSARADEPADAGAGAATQAKQKTGLIKLDATAPLWLDKEHRRVVLVGKVCLREGQLEMFACPEGTKEHESVLSVPVETFKAHAALLALNVTPGHPVQFAPEYKAAEGPVIDVALYWSDAAGQRHSAWAQDWVRDAQTGKSLAEPWIFGGSGFWVDEKTGRREYMANQGEFICVSNFSSAMLDLPIESSDKAGQLLFTAATERIPPVGTKVTLVLSPRVKRQGK